MEKIKKIKQYNIYEPNPEKVEVAEYGIYIKDFAEEIFTKNDRINFGKSADVFRDSLNGCCYKVITRQSESLLSAEDESMFLLELQKINKDVKTPDPLFSLDATVSEDNGMLSKKSLICMERIEGVSLKDVLENRVELPKNFDFNLFAQSLKEFVINMNNNLNIYHRDLHEGNIMVDNITAMPWVIDFGLSKKKNLTDEDPYKTEVDVRNKVFTFKNDQDNVLRVLEDLDNFLKFKSSIKDIGQDISFNKNDFAFNNISKISLNEVHSLSENITDAVNTMTREKINATQIPGSLGLWLVKGDTLEFEKRKESKLILFPKIINQERYFICRN